MNYVATITLLAGLAGPLSQPVRAGYFQAYKPPIEARAGDAATGTVVRQDPRTLILNTTPCYGDRDKQIILFHSPFRTKPAPAISCPDGTTLQQVTANQD